MVLLGRKIDQIKLWIALTEEAYQKGLSLGMVLACHSEQKYLLVQYPVEPFENSFDDEMLILAFVHISQLNPITILECNFQEHIELNRIQLRFKEKISHITDGSDEYTCVVTIDDLEEYIDKLNEFNVVSIKKF